MFWNLYLFRFINIFVHTCDSFPLATKYAHDDETMELESWLFLNVTYYVVLVFVFVFLTEMYIYSPYLYIGEIAQLKCVKEKFNIYFIKLFYKPIVGCENYGMCIKEVERFDSQID